MTEKSKQRARAEQRATGESYQSARVRRTRRFPPGSFGLVCDICCGSLATDAAGATIVHLADRDSPRTVRRFYACHKLECEREVIDEAQRRGLDCTRREFTALFDATGEAERRRLLSSQPWEFEPQRRAERLFGRIDAALSEGWSRGMPKHVTRPDQHVIDEKGQRVFKNAIPPQWVCSEQSDDYGIDYQIEIFELSKPVASRTAVQLKSSREVERADGRIHFLISTRNLATYVDTEPLPVFLVVADVTEGVAYFACLQRYALEELAETNWREQDRVTISLDAVDRVDNTERFKTAILNAQTWNAIRRPAAIEGSLLAEESRLRSIDPRFRASITASTTGQRIKLDALEPVAFNMSVDASREKRIALECGDRVLFEPGEVAFEGMPLWEAFKTGADGVQIQVGQEFPIAVTCSVIRKDGDRYDLPNLEGKVTRGIGGFRLECALLTTLFRAALRATVNPGATTSSIRTDISLSLEPWVGCEVRSVPFFNEVRQLARYLGGDAQLQLTAQLPGRNPPGPIIPAVCGDGLAGVVQALEAIEKARAVAARLNVPIYLRRLVRADDLRMVQKLYDVAILGEHRERADNLKATARAGLDLRRDLITKIPSSLRSVPEDGTFTVGLFGSEVTCPLGELEFTHAVGFFRVHRRRAQTIATFRGTKDSELITRMEAAPPPPPE